MPDARQRWAHAQAYGAQGQWKEAAAEYAAIAQAESGFVPAWLELSLALEHLDAYQDALRAALSAARPDPGVHPLVAIAVVRRLRRFELIPEMARYVEATGIAMRLPPERLVDLAGFFSSAGLHARSLGWVRHALQLKPGLFEAHNMHGLVLMFLGRMDEAVRAFERALALSPKAAQVYSSLSRIARVDAGSSHVDTLRRLLAAAPLDRESESHLAYALHNELHALGEYQPAWAALERACRARRSTLDYDHARTLRTFDAIRHAAERPVAPPSNGGLPSVVPIFIVGMHRSGTTLLERMLAGSPDIADAGETYTLPSTLRFATDHFFNGALDEIAAGRLQHVDLGFVASRFLESMAWRSEGRAFVTEKLNPNFQLVGTIASALPGARILHMVRDAADTCFSNLRTMFTMEAPYSYDQVELADYFKAYRDLMQFWRDRLPGRLVDVDYGAMVADPPAMAMRVAEACGVPFAESMLQVDRDGGAVSTASVDLVRKGILKDRGGAWRPYQAHLTPMLERLAAHGLA